MKWNLKILRFGSFNYRASGKANKYADKILVAEAIMNCITGKETTLLKEVSVMPGVKHNPDLNDKDLAALLRCKLLCLLFFKQNV